jgi:hypothetical protein
MRYMVREKKILQENRLQNSPHLQLLMLGALVVGLVAFQGCTSSQVYREGPPPAVMPQGGEYDIPDLNMYGTWISIYPYGHVWRPSVVAGWRPFSYGHWVYSDVGWTWVSYEPFGWIVYHYGSWYWSEEDQWVWVPGYGGWSPATVDWMQYGDYVCWAPLAARGLVWRRPWEGGNSSVWMVVRSEEFTRDNVGERRIDVADIRKGGRPEGATHRAPGPRDIERRTHTTVATVNIGRAPIAAGRNQIHKMEVPAAEAKRIEKYKGKVEKEVLKRPNQGEHR